MSTNLNEFKAHFFDVPIDLFCVINQNTHKILEANVAFETILGWSVKDVVGQTLEKFTTSPTDIANIEKAFSKIRLGIRSITFETEFHTKNNLVRSIDWKCHVDIDNQHIFAVGRDITAHKEAQKVLLEQSQIDPITGVTNRQTFLTLLKGELSGAARHHYAAAIIMVDIDHFRDYNEKYGIQKGDECLRQVATALKTFLRRKTDFLARFKNDGFVILLPHNNLEKALKAAEYLRANLEKLSIQHHKDATHRVVTISLGVAAIPENATKEMEADIVLSGVERALKISQQNGGNQVNFVENL
ncbi:MAG TPA: sensor domain-containing diguanylate cyclase [Coxiellaceae bacterium]|nr:MAG: hypothetical protein A3E81_06215 [Gammaproteobacteria bacterium RIFCSPHIGHO2_12_FULL_36_30]HLB56857.1 sensor domain-containing diguanylate cyclase [Coxiellaceae bacterium]